METDKHIFTECEHYAQFREEFLADTEVILKSEEIKVPAENQEQKIWCLILMEQADTFLTVERKATKKFTLLDGLVKHYLERTWRERSNWIIR